MKTIKGNAQAWIGKYSNFGPGNMPTSENVSQLVFLPEDHDGAHFASDGYTKVGSASIEVTLFDTKELIENKAGSLRQEIKKVKADAHVAVMQLETQLQNLLAIEHTPS